MNTAQKLRRALIDKGLSPAAVKSPAAGDFTPTAIIDSVKTPAIPSSLSTPYTDALTQAGSIKAPEYNTAYTQALAENLAKLQKPQAATSYKSTKLPGAEMTYGDLESSRSKIAEKAQNIATKTQKKDQFWENIVPSSEEVKTPAFSPSPVAIPEISVKSGDTDNIFKQRENADKKVSQAAQGLIGNFSKEDKTLVLPKGYEDIEEISTGRMLANVNPVVGMNTRTVMGEAKEPVQKEIKTINDEISTLDSKIAQLKKENQDNGIYARRYGKSSEASKVSAEKEISSLEAQRSELIKKRAEKQTYQQQIESIEKIAVYADYQKLLDEDPEAYRRIIDGKRIDGNDTMLTGHDAFLTDDEKNIYYYLRATQGKIVAQGFLDFMDSELRFRDAEKYYNDINRGDAAWLKKAATVFVGNVANSVSGIAGGIKQFFSDTPVEQWELSDAAAYIQEKEDGFGGFAYDVLGLVGHMTPSMLAAWAGSTFSGLFGATASTAANVGKAAGAATTYLSASGNAYAEKIKQGYSPDEARIYANLVGAAEAGLQYALGGISKLGRNANTGLIAQKIAGIENAFARASAELAHRGFKEIAEEELQLFVEPFITSMVFDEEYTAPEFEEMLYTALLSFASTGVFEISDVTKEGLNQRKNNKMDKELGTWLRSEGTDADGDVTRAVIGEGLESAPGTDSRTYAEKLFKRTDAGKTVSDRQLGHMYRANVDAINAENNTASAPETVEKNYSLNDSTQAPSSGYLVDTTPAPILHAKDIKGDPVENAQRYNVLDTQTLAPKNSLEQSVVDSAVDIRMNNSANTRSLVETAMKISAESSVPITFTTTERLKNMGYDTEKYNISGLYSPSNGIIINAESPKAGQAILGHELVHWLKSNGLYDSYSQAITAYANEIGTYQKTFDNVTSLYKTVKNADYGTETVAELTGEYLFTDEAFVSKLAEHRNLFQRVYDKIRHYYNMAVAGSPEARLLEKAKYTFERAYRAQSGKNNSDSSNNVQYAINYKNYTNSDFENNAKYLVKMSPVKDLTGNEFSDKSIPLKDRIKKFFESIGNNVETTEFGDVALNNSSLHDDFGHGTTYNKAVSYAAIPAVLKNGVVIDSQLRGGDNYERIVVAAPITISGELYYMGVMIQRDFQSQRLYLHDVIIANAKETISSALETSPSTTGVSRKNNNLHMTSILKKALLVNSEFSLTPKESQTGEVTPVEVDNENDQPRKYDFTADETPVSEKFNRILEARQNTLDDLISDRYATEESFNDEISYLEMQYRNMKNPETTKKGIELSQRIAKTKEARDTRIAELDSKIEKARKKVDQLDEKEYSRIVQRKAKEQERQNLIAKTVGSTVNWVDKPFGTSLYGLNTLRRNLRDIVRDADGKPNIELADRIYDMLQGSYSRHEAQMKKEILSIANKFAELKINNTESTYIQMLGELRSNPDTTLTREVVEDFYSNHKKKINVDKVEKAITMARETYDSLFVRLNEVLREQGMQEIPYRQGYFPHYTKEKNGFFAKLLNWKSKNNSLPTDIAGLTEEFNPKKSYQPFDKRREGDTTEYNFLEGLDNYVRGALDWIYHIEDIALRRSFEDYIRYEHSDKAMRDTIDDIRSEGLDPEQERALIDEALKGREHQLGNFLTDFRAQTNVLAGKKHSDDRSVEQLFGRGTYSFAQNVSSRINSNMVAANVASALTNFIPLTQSWAEVSPKQTLIAMKDTLKSFRHDDGIREKSVFLTNRLTEDKRLYQTGWDKASDKAAALMGAIDSFVSETIWRAKYAQNLEKGMSEDEAISNADDYCAGLIASRSRGEMPGHFDKQSALWKVFTSFQLEVNNQYGYLFKDLPQNKETKLGVVWGLVKMFLGAYGFNWLYEKITGRKPALDPIGIVADFIYDIAEDDEDKWMNLGESLLEQTPFIGSLFGGGRIPLQSAIPDVSNTWNAIKSEDWGTLGWELGKPVAYLGLPTGGGQIYKTAKGIDTIIDGGSYKTDSKGNERLQYPYYSDEGANSVLQGAKAVVFGKNSLPTAGNWVDNNFNTLSVDQTKAYEGMISAGDGQRKSFEFIEKIRGLETHKEKRQALNDSDFSDEAKYSAYYNLLATKNENEPEKDERKAVLDKLENHSAVNTILAIKTAEDNHSKIQAVADADLTPNDRKLIFKEYISRDSYAEATSLTRKGISYDKYFDAYFEYDKIKADNKDTKVRKTEFARWLNNNSRGMTDSERAALREALIGEGETSYEKLAVAGVDNDSAYSLGLALDSLEPDVWHYHTTVQPYQKYRAIIDAGLSEEQTLAAMKAVSSESQAKKIEKLASLGIDLKHYVSLAETVGEAGKSIANLSNAELKMWIERMPLPVLSVHSKISWPKIKSTLYDVLSGTTKAESDTLSRLRESLKNLKK